MKVESSWMYLLWSRTIRFRRNSYWAQVIVSGYIMINTSRQRYFVWEKFELMMKTLRSRGHINEKGSIRVSEEVLSHLSKCHNSVWTILWGKKCEGFFLFVTNKKKFNNTFSSILFLIRRSLRRILVPTFSFFLSSCSSSSGVIFFNFVFSYLVQRS